jgi:osmoprotectant transport system permease protein
VRLRPNRLVDGAPHALAASGGAWGLIALALALAALAAAVVRVPRRGAVLLACGAGLTCAWVLALGSAATRLVPVEGTDLRLSLAAGAWLMLVGSGIVWFQGARNAPGWGRALAAIAVAAALLGGWMGGGLARLAIPAEYASHSDIFWQLVVAHVGLSVGATAIAVVLGVPLGIAASRVAGVRTTVIPVAGVVQTIPSLALYGLLIIPLGMLGLPTIGPLPALVALTLYALLPIIRNTFLGVSAVDPAAVDAGRGMGMSRGQLLSRVELPLALPLVLEGVRASLVMTIGVAAVMAITGAPTLGTLVFEGWGEVAVDLVLLGALPMVVLSILADQGMRALRRVAVSPGIAVGEAGPA